MAGNTVRSCIEMKEKRKMTMKENHQEKNRVEKQMEFIVEMDKTKQIVRQTYLADASRKENDAEHAWHLAMMAYLLREHANAEIDVAKTMMMVLIHDLVEIDAGDTYAYDEKGNADKREREVRAADRIFPILPSDQAEEMRALWEEFEADETPEAKFAHTLDRIQPILLNDASGGKSWREHGVTLDKVLKRNEYTKDGSEVLWDYAKQCIDKNVELGNICNSSAI